MLMGWKIYYKQEAIRSICGDNPLPQYAMENDVIVRWNEENAQEQPSDAEFETKITELKKLQPMKHLRDERNRLLTETDWMASQDRTMTQAEKDYRQELRDLPTTQTPTLNEDGDTVGITWPTKPTE